MTKQTLPLSGITVLSFEHAIAAPLCTRQLAELGAKIIKVERRVEGDFARKYDDRTKGLSSHFVWTNRSKLSLTLDLKHPDSADILNRLLEEADVLVQNLAPSAAKRLGLSYEALHTKFNQLVVCNISGYGESGPYKDRKAYDLLVQAEAGFLSVTGTSDAGVKSGISIADIAAGMQAQSAIMAALMLRARTGEGSEIDISMLEAMVEWMGYPLNYAYDGAEPPPRTGSDHASIYPYGAFRCRDGKAIMLGLQNEREWQDFCELVLSDSPLIKDSRFLNNQSRSQNRLELKKIIDAKFKTLEVHEIKKKLGDANIAYADVNEMKDVWNHPQLTALKRIVDIESTAGSLKSFLPPGNNNRYEPVLAPVPAVGEHTEEILFELGFSSERVKRFKTKGVV
ncbi:MAG: CaiB/BaiF CoA transferase family protein [Pseudohongiellaceae bacterium]